MEETETGRRGDGETGTGETETGETGETGRDKDGGGCPMSVKRSI